MPRQDQQTPAQATPTKKRRTWLWVLLGIVRRPVTILGGMLTWFLTRHIGLTTDAPAKIDAFLKAH